MEKLTSNRSKASVHYRQYFLSQKDTSCINEYVALINDLETENERLIPFHDDNSRFEIELNTFFIDHLVEKALTILDKPVVPMTIMDPAQGWTTFEHWRERAWTDLRIEYRHLDMLFTALRFPAQIALPDKKGTVTGQAMLLIVLYFLAFPRRLTDMQDKFQMHSTKLSLILKVAIDELYDAYA